MRLLLKFNLVLIFVFALGASIAGYVSHRFLQQSAEEQVTQEARLMVEAAAGMRNYTATQVGPLLTAHQMHTNTFLPQTIPFYAATEAFNYLRKTYPDYTYKEAALNPTNPRDRAVDWEADVIEEFRNHPERTEITRERDTPEGKSRYLARPIMAEASCLECHGSPAKAPAALVKLYGRDNGFNWKAGETVGAQIVSVPVALPVRIAADAFRTEMLSLGGVALAMLVLLDLLMTFLVIRPVTNLSAKADEISTGNLDVPEIPAKGRDQIAQLARSFNRMYQSLVKAIRLLEAR